MPVITSDGAEEKTVSLADLVMLQTVGRLEEFLQQFSDGADCTGLLEEAWGATTTPRLFTEIVHRSVEAQFGEKHAALRELVQNSIDAYDKDQRNRAIRVTFNPNGSSSTLSVKDEGKGMSQLELVRDLLIPYNSGGKELDPDKIGKHGIGWFSTMNLGHSVDVVTKANRSQPISASVFQKDGEWMANIKRPPQAEPLSSPSGTRVTVHIDSGSTDLKTALMWLYHYAGHVSKDYAITFNGEPINALNWNYTLGGEARVVNGGLEGKLSVFLSTRRFFGESNSPRFAIRDNNPQHLLITQRGLFVKFDNNPYAEGSIHNSFFQGLTDKGLDFWVELPPNVSLTKGRNNVIADDQPIVTEAMHKAFEDVIVESVLSNSLILDRCSDTIDKILATLFKEKYAHLVEKAERRKYNFQRRFASFTAPIGRGIASLVNGLTHYGVKGVTFVPSAAIVYGPRTPRYMAGTARYVAGAVERGLRQLPGIIAETMPAVVGLISASADAANNATKWALEHYRGIATTGAGFALAGFGAYVAYKNFDKILDSLPYIGLAVAATAGAAVLVRGSVALAHAIRPDFSIHIGYKAWELKPPNWLGSVANRVGAIKESLDDLVHRIFAMKNLEEKREEKLRRRTEKVAQRYLSKLHMDGLTKRIAGKNIVKGEYVTTFNIIPGHISLDELVRLFSKGRISTKENRFLKSGSFVLDLTNPLSKTLYEQLSQIRSRVENDYNPKVLEDYLHDIQFLTQELLLTILDLFMPSRWGKYHTWLEKVDQRYYKPSTVAHAGSGIHWLVNHSLGAGKSLVRNLLSEETYKGPVGVIKSHLQAQGRKDKKPEEHRRRINWRDTARSVAHSGLSGLELIAEAGANVGLYGVKAVAKAGMYGAKAVYFLATEPFILAAKVLNPANYAGYADPLTRPFPVLWRYSWKHSSPYFGIGTDSFEVRDPVIKKLDSAGLNRTTGLSNLGWEYKAFHGAVSNLEHLISQSSGLQPRSLHFLYSRFSYQHGIGLSSGRGDTIAIDLNSDFVKSTIASISRGEYSYGVFLPFINAILHEKAHQKIGRFKHSQDNIATAHQDSGRYDSELYEAQEQVTQQFLQFTEERGISLDEQLRQSVIPRSFYESKNSNPVSVEELTALTRMRPLQLATVKRNLQRGRRYHYSNLDQTFYILPHRIDSGQK